jgi:hypothetical protein
MDVAQAAQEVAQLLDCWMLMIMMTLLCPQTRPVVLRLLTLKSALDVQSICNRKYNGI